MNYDEVYSQFLEDTDFAMRDDGQVDFSVLPASFQQVSLLSILMDSNAMNPFSDEQIRRMEVFSSSPLNFRDASMLINEILSSQPNEVPHGEKRLAKWIKTNKL